MVIFPVYRNGAHRGWPSAAALPGGRVPLANNCHRLPDATGAGDHVRSVPTRQGCPPHHLSQPQLCRPADGAGDESAAGPQLEREAGGDVAGSLRPRRRHQLALRLRESESA